MRKLLLVVLLLAGQSLLAQEPPPAQKPPEQTAPAPAQPQAAPKLGHPLDPADVDVLTGKNKAPASGAYGYSATPYLYLNYPLGQAAYGSSRPFGNRSFASLPAMPFFRSGFRARSLFFFDTRNLFSPRLFFSGFGRTGTSTFFFSTPARPAFHFRR